MSTPLALVTVFTVVEKHVSEGEVEDVEHVLPKELRDLWPAAAQQERSL